MDFGLLIDRFNDPNKKQGRMIPKEYDSPNIPVKIGVDVPPVVSNSVELVKPFFRDNYGVPLIMYDTSHGGGFAGFVIPFERFDENPGESSKLEARISFQGKPGEKNLVSSEDLSRIHLSAYAQRGFFPKNYRSFLSSLPPEERANSKISEIVNVSLRWTVPKGYDNLMYESVWENPNDAHTGFPFHEIRSSYFLCFDFPSEDNVPITGRRNPVFPLSPGLDFLPKKSDGKTKKGYDKFRNFLIKTIGFLCVPSIGTKSIEDSLPGFPEIPMKFTQRDGFPNPEEAPDFLFGKVLPYLDRFTRFEI